jgi:hypothetical protein
MDGQNCLESAVKIRNKMIWGRGRQAGSTHKNYCVGNERMFPIIIIHSFILYLTYVCVTATFNGKNFVILSQNSNSKKGKGARREVLSCSKEVNLLTVDDDDEERELIEKMLFLRVERKHGLQKREIICVQI